MEIMILNKNKKFKPQNVLLKLKKVLNFPKVFLPLHEPTFSK